MEARLVITNAAAGSAEQSAVDAALAVLREDGPLDVLASGGADDLDEALASRGGGASTSVVVAAGGDGSLHALVDALHRRGELSTTTVGLIPLGTGNDFARGVGVSLDPVEAAHQLVAARPHRLDLLVDAGGGVVVNAVHVGLGAEAGRQASVWKHRLGKAGYLVGAVKAGLTTPGLNLAVTVDGATLPYSSAVVQVAVSNGPYVGGGTALAPGAEPDDGAADVVVSYADAPLARLGYALRLRRGEHPRRDDVVTTRGRRVDIRGDEFWTNTDGELAGPRHQQSWELVPNAWSFLR